MFYYFLKCLIVYLLSEGQKRGAGKMDIGEWTTEILHVAFFGNQVQHTTDDHVACSCLSHCVFEWASVVLFAEAWLGNKRFMAGFVAYFACCLLQRHDWRPLFVCPLGR